MTEITRQCDSDCVWVETVRSLPALFSLLWLSGDDKLLHIRPSDKILISTLDNQTTYNPSFLFVCFVVQLGQNSRPTLTLCVLKSIEALDTIGNYSK